MFEPDKTIQPQLFAFTHRDLVGQDSDVWLFIDLFEALELKRFNQKYRGQGQLAKEPRMILRTIFYGLTHGIATGRKLESVCRNDNRFIVLSGGTRPDRRTLDRFVRRHEDLMRELFVDIVRLAQKMGLVSLGRVAIDGSRFKANTSAKSMKYEKMQRAVDHIEENLNRLRDDLKESNSEESDDSDKLTKEMLDQERRLEKIKKAASEIEAEYKAKISRRNGEIPDGKSSKSLNDSEALALRHKSKAAIFGYNVQAAVDDKNQIIVAAELHGKGTDYESLPGLLDQVEVNCGAKAEAVLADLGYKSAENIKDIESRGSQAFVAVGSDRENIDAEFFEQITPSGKPHQYKCMNGKELPINSRRENGRTDFNLPKNFCNDCPFTESCKAFGKKNISVMAEVDRKVMTALYERARNPDFQEVYARRKVIVEPVFGNIKNKGLKIFVVGRKKVSTWWLMACTAHNIEKIVKAQIRALMQKLKNKFHVSNFFEVTYGPQVLRTT